MTLTEKINGPWHKQVNQIFLFIVLAHWAEHIFQIVQIYLFHWPVHHAHGATNYAVLWRMNR
jgi:hypothetical protein